MQTRIQPERFGLLTRARLAGFKLKIDNTPKGRAITREDIINYNQDIFTAQRAQVDRSIIEQLKEERTDLIRAFGSPRPIKRKRHR